MLVCLPKTDVNVMLGGGGDGFTAAGRRTQSEWCMGFIAFQTVPDNQTFTCSNLLQNK